ncbi:MAG: hypothetical protein EOP51_11240 [Sphingobacteriales bacterium]|nr:MAG: hypothetical protein EOP51_11240 [Sphingobacteriales bacterium]
MKTILLALLLLCTGHAYAQDSLAVMAIVVRMAAPLLKEPTGDTSSANVEAWIPQSHYPIVAYLYSATGTQGEFFKVVYEGKTGWLQRNEPRLDTHSFDYQDMLKAGKRNEAARMQKAMRLDAFRTAAIQHNGYSDSNTFYNKRARTIAKLYLDAAAKGLMLLELHTETMPGNVQIVITISNQTNKTIKDLVFHFSAIDGKGNKIYNQNVLAVSGPVKPYDNNAYQINRVFATSDVRDVRATKIDVLYTDNTRKTITDPVLMRNDTYTQSVIDFYESYK